MKSHESHTYLANLENRVFRLVYVVKEEFETMDPLLARWHPGTDQWSALECLEHTALATKWHMMYAEKGLRHAQRKGWGTQHLFSSSWFGRFLVELVTPTVEGKIRGRRTARSALRPSSTPQPPQRVIQDYVTALHELVELIREARSVNLGRAKVALPIPFVKVPLGDALAYTVGHAERHLLQAKQAAHVFQDDRAVPKEVL